jgi:hypothetical protein
VERKKWTPGKKTNLFVNNISNFWIIERNFDALKEDAVSLTKNFY